MAFKISEALKESIWLKKREVERFRLSRGLHSKLFYSCNIGQEATFLRKKVSPRKCDTSSSCVLEVHNTALV